MQMRHIFFFLSISIILLAITVQAQGVDIKVNGVDRAASVRQGDTLSWRITGLLAGDIVNNQVWYDANGNGNVDPLADVPMFFFPQQDNGQFGDGPPDMDGMANGVIYSVFPIGFAPGRYIFLTVYKPPTASSSADTATFSMSSLPGEPAMISGKVTFMNGLPAPNILVRADCKEQIPPDKVNEWWAVTNQNGDYNIVLDSNAIGKNWRVEVHLFMSKFTSVPAETVVNTTQYVWNVNFKLVSGTIITGRVVEKGGANPPILDADIRAENSTMPGQGMDFHARTLGDGRFFIAVPAGTYKISFHKEGYRDIYYNQVFSREEATDIVVTNQDTIKGIDAYMSRGAVISGRVTKNGIGIRASVNVHDTTAPYNWRFGTGTDDLGYYKITVTPGVYSVSFQTEGRMIVYNQKQMFPGDPIVVPKVDTMITDINADFSVVGAKIITGLVTHNQLPLEGATVLAIDMMNTSTYYGGFSLPNGRYYIEVPQGSYKVVFQKKGFVNVWFQQANLWQAAQPVVVPQLADTIREINANLIRGGEITGVVTKDGMPIPAYVSIHSAMPPFEQQFEGWGDKGTYTATVPPGTYSVAFHYGGEQLIFNQKTEFPGDPVIVPKVDTTITGINADFTQLLRRRYITGTVTEFGNNMPISGVTVILEPLRGGVQLVFDIKTGPDGKYILEVTEGIYKIEFYKAGYAKQMFNGKHLFWEADTIFVTMDDDTIRNINAKLIKGGVIGGRVTVNGMGVKCAVVVHDTAMMTQHPFTPLFSGFSSDNGYYLLVVPPGTYYVAFYRDNNMLVYSQKRNFPGDPLTITNLNDTLGGIDGEFAEFPPQPERPKIVSVRDVPNDNGRQVFVTWKCPEDGMNSMINEYAVYRLDGKLLTFLVKVPATRDSIYQVVAPTLGDSNKVNGLWLSTFVIRALTPFPGQHYTSDPFNGYSIDNLPPHAPTGLNASLLAGMLTIKWERSMDKDFQYYAVYRSNTPIVSTEGLRPYYVDTSTVFTERTTAGVTYYYRITVFDWNGNESKPSDQIKTDGNSVVSVEGTDEVPKAFTLNQNYPNPFNPSTTIAYDIPSASFVSLKVYTILGQEVMTLVESQHQPGRYTITFSANGLSSGMYIYKLTAGQFQSVKRMLLMK